MSDAKKPKEDQTARFTVDEGTQAGEIPSVTKLLNRKSLNLKTPPPPRPGTLPPSPDSSSPNPRQIRFPPATPNPASPSASPSEIAIPLDSPVTSPTNETSSPPSEGGIALTLDAPESFELESSGPASPSTSSIQPATRKAARSSPQLVLWDRAQLEAQKDPLGKGILALLQKGASCALFLAIAPPPSGSPVPHFVASAAMVPTPDTKEKLPVWTGLKWDPTVVPELWNYFVKSGNAELSPPGTNTNQASNRNVVRAAFGASKTEWLLLVRVGPAQACRGVVAFISSKTLLMDLAGVLPLLSSNPNPT